MLKGKSQGFSQPGAAKEGFLEKVWMLASGHEVGRQTGERAANRGQGRRVEEDRIERKQRMCGVWEKSCTR